MSIVLQEHQKLPVKYIKRKDVNGILLYHSLGSGKTITSITMAEKFPNKEVVVIVPASLQDNYKKELKKAKVKSLKRYQVISYESFHKYVKAINNPQDIEEYESREELEQLSVTKLRNLCGKFFPLPKCKKQSKKRLLEILEKIRSDFSNYREQQKVDSFLKDKILIVDEAHRLRNYSSKIAKRIIAESKYAFKVILLTGTPIVNFPSDIAPLVNSVKKENALYRNKFIFDENYITYTIKKYKVPIKKFGITIYEKVKFKKIKDIKNGEEFGNKIEGAISFYENTDRSEFPEVIRHYFPVIMSRQQMRLHSSIEREELTKEDIKMLKGEWAVDDESSSAQGRINAYLNKTRQVSNLVKGELEKNKKSPMYGLRTSPKLQTILSKVVTGEKPAIVYSNFLPSGLYPLAKMLDVSKIKYRIFTGEVKTDEKKQIIEDYNKRKFDVLLVSSSGSEGLDLKRTRQIHIMEPHWNEAKVQQVIGRGIRYQSHSDLPPEERKVDVYYWYSVYSDNESLSADKYLIDIGNQKKKVALKFYDVIKNHSIEFKYPEEKEEDKGNKEKEKEKDKEENKENKDVKSTKSLKSKKSKKISKKKVKNKDTKSQKSKKSKKSRKTRKTKKKTTFFGLFGGGYSKPNPNRVVSNYVSPRQVELGLV